MKDRHRRHANPLAFQKEITRPDYDAIFKRRAPIEVEIGFGKGQFLIAMAKARPHVNVVGLEIREFLVEHVMKQGLPNVYAIHCNANTAIDVLFKEGEVSRFYVHFPDPWFKKRHKKRRVVNNETALLMKKLLAPDGEIHVMTDYEPIGIDMHACFKEAGFDGGPVSASTTGFTSEREDWHMSIGHPIYRFLFAVPKAR